MEMQTFSFQKGKEVLYSFDRAFGYSYSNSEDEDDDEDDSTYEDDNSFVHFLRTEVSTVQAKQFILKALYSPKTENPKRKTVPVSR